MPLYKDWIVKNIPFSEELLNYCGSNKVLASLLAGRGIDTPEKAEKFLNPLNVKLSSPDVFCSMKKTVERVKTAVQNNEHIAVYGDFDADGITAAAILYLTLKEIGASCSYYLPDRASESHGLNTKALVQIISKRHAKLIITVDCGISNVSEVNFAKSLGAGVIITDHHEAPEILPDAFAVINPKATGSLDSTLSSADIQSLNQLAGAGISLKFAYALLEEFNKTDFADNLLPMAAIGTIADAAELQNENRTIAAAGIELIRHGAHKGIQKLLKTAGVQDEKTVNSETIAFTIAPRLNAAGRLDTAETAIQILISEDDALLEKTAAKLNDLNELRQTLCSETFEAACSMKEKDSASNRNAIILHNPEWHIGIIGITASKLVEKYNKPVFLMTSDLKNPDIIRCSARSIKGINVHAVLSSIKDVFEGFGGHKMAAGFSFDTKKISFDKFKSMLLNAIDEFSSGIDFKKVTVQADMEPAPSDITAETAELIDKLQPFGYGNPSPLFVMKDTRLLEYRMMGQNADHLKFKTQKDGSTLECIKWSTPEFNLPAGAPLDILFSIRLNTFNDKTSVQLMIEDIHSELLNQKEQSASISFLDHRKKRGILEKVIDFVLSSKKTSAVYIENPALIKTLKLPDTLKNKLFSTADIPKNIQQIMFFDAPNSKEDFEKIIKTASPEIVHLMNFGIDEITSDNLIIKLSGMLKYALANLGGIIDINRAAKALSVPAETAECALMLLEDTGMIDLEKENEETFKISYIHPSSMLKIKNNEIFSDLETRINDINSFRRFYLNSPVEEIKEAVLH